MKFTKASIAALTMPEGKSEHFVWDDDCPGFGLRMRSTGSKSWFVQYRFAGRQRRESFGDIRKLGLEDARKTARQRYAKLQLGTDPAAEREQVKAQAALSLKVVAGRYLDFKRDKVRQSSLKALDHQLNRQWKPLHNRSLRAIERADVAARLQELIETFGPMSAKNARDTLSALYVWSIKEGLCESNPVLATNNPGEGKLSRDRVLSDSEIAAIWNACEDDSCGRGIKMLLLTGARRNEIGKLEWKEINFDTGVLTIPGERTKNSCALMLPLPKIAIELLRSQPRKHEDYVFVGAHGKCFASWNHEIEKLNARIAKAKGKPLPHWQVHDLRRTMRTNLGKLRVPPHIAELCINHVKVKGGVQAVYDRYTYQPEIGQALARWAEHLLAIVEGRDSKVVPMPTTRRLKRN
jgi:integrase